MARSHGHVDDVAASAAVHLGEASLHKPRHMDTRGQWKDFALLFSVGVCGILLIVGISFSGFFMTYQTSHVFSAQGFTTNVLACVDLLVRTALDPVHDQLHAALTQSYRMDWNLSTWDGISALAPSMLSFLHNVFTINRRSLSVICVNMGFDTADVESAGGYEAWRSERLQNDDWGDDRAVATMDLVGWDNTFTNTTQVRTVDEEGSLTNPWYLYVRSDTSYQPYPVGPLTNFTRRELLEEYWLAVHRWDLQPRQVFFTKVGIEDTIPPNSLLMSGMVAVYERNQVGVDAGRRVGVTVIGFELQYLTELLATIDLQGGFVFLVEESTGILVAASDPTVAVLADGPDGPLTEAISPIDSSQRLVRGAASIMKATNSWSWSTLSHDLLQGEIDGVNHFVQCMVFSRYNFSFVGVYVIPANLVLGDFTSNSALIGIYFNILCSVLLVACIFVVVCDRFRTLRRKAVEQGRSMDDKIREIALAACIAEKLANYDLRAADQVLKEEILAACELAVPLAALLDNLTSYSPFLPDSLFLREDRDGIVHEMPNQALARAMKGRMACLTTMISCVQRLRDPDYTLVEYSRDIQQAIPELCLYTTAKRLSSSLSATDEFERTMGALYAVYCFLRLDLDGKEVFSFGVNEGGRPCTEPQEHAAEKREFWSTVNWRAIQELVFKADLLRLDARGGTVIHHDRVVAMLVLQAVHDVMKNAELTPSVLPQHAPYQGYAAQAPINDHDVALAYVMEHFPLLLPSFVCLQPGQRAPILFVQGKMGFNNGWLVQGEAPPGLLFSKFKQMIARGTASKSDISFYFVHWLTDLAGAEAYQGRPWPGAQKFTTHFSPKVLESFVDSFGFVDRLAFQSEVQVMEDYLANRWNGRGLRPDKNGCIALQRLVLMAQGFEQEVVTAFSLLSTEERSCLSEELARTGRRDQFQRAPAAVTSSPQGPAIMVYYAPALLQKAGAKEVLVAMRVLAAVFRAARRAFPCHAGGVESTAIVRIDALKAVTPSAITEKQVWYVRRVGDFDAEVVTGEFLDDGAFGPESSTMHRLDFTQLSARVASNGRHGGALIHL